MPLEPEQIDFLLRPLHPSRVQHAQGQSHLAAWDVRRHLLRVFGWGGWDFRVVACDLISERSKWDESNPLRGRHTVVYRVLGRLNIMDAEGNVLASFEDGATGDAANQPSLGDAHDMALKTAMSQALKRCAMNLGDGFGLSLYNGGSTEPVVGRSLAHSTSVDGPIEDTTPVAAGDDDAHAQPAPAPEPAAPVVAREAERARVHALTTATPEKVEQYRALVLGITTQHPVSDDRDKALLAVYHGAGAAGALGCQVPVPQAWRRTDGPTAVALHELIAGARQVTTFHGEGENAADPWADDHADHLGSEPQP